MLGGGHKGEEIAQMTTQSIKQMTDESHMDFFLTFLANACSMTEDTILEKENAFLLLSDVW